WMKVLFRRSKVGTARRKGDPSNRGRSVRCEGSGLNVAEVKRTYVRPHRRACYWVASAAIGDGDDRWTDRAGWRCHQSALHQPLQRARPPSPRCSCADTECLCYLKIDYQIPR